jgi:hypothetical protein
MADNVIVEIDNGRYRKLAGLAKFNATRKAAGELKTICQLPGFCPVWTGDLRKSHKVAYLGGEAKTHAVIAGGGRVYYAYLVHEGKQGRRANRWMNRATDALKAGGAGVT